MRLHFAHRLLVQFVRLVELVLQLLERLLIDLLRQRCNLVLLDHG